MVEILERGDVLEIAKPRRWGRWSLQESRYLAYSSIDYLKQDVDLWGLSRHQELVEWLCHIREDRDPANFLRAMKAIFGQVAWQHETFSGKDLVIAYWQASEPTEA